MDESACVCVCGGDGRGGVPSSTLPQGHTTVISDQIKPHQTHRIKECAAVTVCTKSLTSRPETPPPTHTHTRQHTPSCIDTPFLPTVSTQPSHFQLLQCLTCFCLQIFYIPYRHLNLTLNIDTPLPLHTICKHLTRLQVNLEQV